MQAGYYSILSVAMCGISLFPLPGESLKNDVGFFLIRLWVFFFQWPHDKKEFLFNNNKYTGWTYVSSKEMKIQSRTNDFYTRSYTTALTRLSQPSVKFLLFYLYFFFFLRYIVHIIAEVYHVRINHYTVDSFFFFYFFKSRAFVILGDEGCWLTIE
jgi:hypothetical protein